MNSTLNGTLNYSLTLDLSGLDLQGMNFNDIQVYKRAAEGQPWQNVADLAGVSLTHNAPYITISGLSTFSDFSLGNNSPLAVNLATFTAIAERDHPSTSSGYHILINWQTVNELNNMGFNLYRAEVTGTSEVPVTWTEQLNSSLIPAQAPGSGQGSTYEFVDEDVLAGESYYYWLEDIEVDGTITRHGPVSATISQPLVVTTDKLTGEQRPLPRSFVWGVLALMILGGGLMVQRRR